VELFEVIVLGLTGDVSMSDQRPGRVAVVSDDVRTAGEVDVPLGVTSGAPAGAPLAERLREATRQAHARAEAQPLQKALIRGEVSLRQFADLTVEMRFLHRSLHGGRGALARHAAFARLLEAIPDMDAIFAADLRALGMQHAASKTPAVSAYARWVEDRVTSDDAVALVGAHYVLMGSANGGAYIARAVDRALGLAPGQGTTWLNPFGSEVLARWRGFQAILNRLDLDAASAEGAIGGALATFAAVETLSGEIPSVTSNRP
jgi:heme oxygenase